MANNNLHKAKKAKNDEFYTQLSDIENELRHYKQHFKDKVVFLNCDDPRESNFYVYFAQNFDHLGLKKLIATHYKADEPTYKLEITRDENGDGKINALDTVETKLKQNGDFRSDEAIAILEEADIVVTNPPFSLFREYIAQLVHRGKKFLFISPTQNIINKNTFQYVKEGKCWLGISKVKEFTTPSGEMKKFGNIGWWTNLSHNKRNEEIVLYKSYNQEEYPKYDNYNAINVNKVSEIPLDYYGVMGVPVTFLEKHNPNQFEILGFTNTGEENKGIRLPNTDHGRALIKGKEIYTRLLIRRK